MYYATLISLETKMVDLRWPAYKLTQSKLYSVVLLVNTSSHGLMSWYPPVHLSIAGKLTLKLVL